MITFSNVTDRAMLSGMRRHLLLDATLHIPIGRYAVLASDLAMRKPVIDLIAGTRPPAQGRIWIGGTRSWAIGRAGFMRGRATGLELIHLIARLYGLNMRICEAVMADAMTFPEALDDSVEHWNALTKLQFGHMIALLPQFDVYVVDGSLPFRKDGFTLIWRALFEERIAGRTLILSSGRASEAADFCDRALVIDQGTIGIFDQLDRAIADFPPRPVFDDPGRSPEPVIDDGLV